MVKKINPTLFYPNTWPYWFLLGLLWLITQLPYKWFMRIGKLFGYIASFIPHYNREVTLINLKLCFSEKTEIERLQMMRRCYESLGMAMLETGFSCFASDKRLKNLVRVHNADFPKYCEGQGVLLIVPHYHVLEIAGRLCAMQVNNLSAVYRPHRKPVIEWMNQKHLSHHFKTLIPRTNGKAMIKLLRDKGCLFFLPDIDAGRKQSVFANFFGIQTASVASVPKLVKLGQAKVVFVHAFRKSDLSGYEISFSKPLENYPSDNELQDVGRVNNEMEKLIRLYPEQYLWQYRRFRTRLVIGDDFYPKKKVRKKKRLK